MAATEIACGGLPLHVFGWRPDQPQQDQPFVVFAAHGRGGKVSDLDELCQRILAAGSNIIVVAFDQRNHGHRLVDSVQNGGWEENPSHIVDMFAIQWGMACDISHMADVLPVKLSIKPRGFGVVGVSLGGHTALLVLANDVRFSVGVSIIGCGDYETLMRQRSSSKPQEFTQKFTPQLAALLHQRDPVHRAVVFREKAVLLLSGQKDKLVPAECNIRFITNVRQVLSPPTNNEQQFSEVIVPGVGHRLAPEMIQATAKWFATHTIVTKEKSLL